jgi:hypothetical protein
MQTQSLLSSFTTLHDPNMDLCKLSECAYQLVIISMSDARWLLVIVFLL